MSEVEIIAAEVSTHLHINSNEIVVASPENEAALNERLLELNEELERYTVRAGKAEYAFAIASGILSGWMDSAFFGEVNITEEDFKISSEQVEDFVKDYAKSKGHDESRSRGGDPLKSAKGYMERHAEVDQDNTWGGRKFGISTEKGHHLVHGKEKIGVNATNHHLADLAHHPTPVGLLSSIMVQFFRVGTFVNKNGEWYFLFVDKSPKKYAGAILTNLAIPAVITGFLNWLVAIAKEEYEAEAEEKVPDAIRTLAHFVASAPMIVEILKCADRWFSHLVSDMAGTKDSTPGMGIPGVFLSLLYEIAALPFLRKSGLLEILNDLYMNQNQDLRRELPFAKQLEKQATPVIFNEIIVRMGCMLIHLVGELKEHDGFDDINWRRVIPFANRTVDRMLMVSTMTFTTFDTADAAIRAAAESGGNWVVFSGKFVARYNFVGAGRAAIAIVKEVSNEKKEMQLIHERMILMDAKAELMFQQLQDFKAELDAKLSEYLIEDIEAFMVGFDYMNEGLRTNDSDLVIHGNVTIQRVLGREVQFESQMEFDELMDSDEPLQL